MAPSDQFARSSRMFASIALVVAALYLAKGLLVPLTLAVLLSFMMSPVCDWLERHGLPRIPSVLVTTFLGFAALGLLVWIAVVQVSELAPKIPEYQANLKAKLHSANAYAIATMSQVTRSGEDIGQDFAQFDSTEEPRGTSDRPYSVRVLSSPMTPLEVFGGVFGAVLGALASTGIVVVLVLFFLMRREDLRDRFIRLIGKDRLTITTQTLEDASTRVSRYLSVLFLLNAGFGFAVGVGLYWIGLPNASLWGILAATLRFVPYLGPWIAAAMPIGLAMAVSAGWVTPLMTIGLFVVLELFSNNVMEPWLYGRSTGVSAVAVLVAAFFWTWLWGVVGLLLATPLTVCLLVIGKHVPQLSFLDILLNNEPVAEPANRVYQRLVAGDQEEAVDLVEDYCRNRPLVEVYDTMLISALALAETHWQRGEIAQGRHEFILQSVNEIIREQGEPGQEMATSDGDDTPNEAGGNSSLVVATIRSGPRVLCLPARCEADEIAGSMLSQLLEMLGCRVEAAPVASSAGELIDLVRNRNAEVVCISAMPPSAVMHARTLCKRLRGLVPAGNLVVGLWHSQGDLNKARDRIGFGADVHVVTTLAGAQEQIGLLLQPPLLSAEMQEKPYVGPKSGCSTSAPKETTEQL